MEEKRYPEKKIPGDMKSSHGGLISMDKLMDEDANPE
jgi:hypothetical protein